MPISRNQTLGFRKSHAFVIGINEYRGLDANLKTAAGDSREIAKRLKALQGFDNVLLMNDVSQAQVATMLDWIKDPQRSASLSIQEKTFTFGSFSYRSQAHWLKTAGEVADTAGLNSLELVIDEGQADELRETLFLAPDNQLDIQPGDSIVFYYAGHGFPGEIKDGPAGYLAATDATNKLLDNDSLLPMDEVYKALSTLDCKHTLLILDCCFAGKFRFSSLSRGRPKPFLMPMYERRYERFKSSNAWQVLVSAGPEQTANDSAKWAAIRDHSPFATTLMEALEGKADVPLAGNRGKAQGDGIITATELFLYVWDRVEKITGEVKPQHPGLFPMAQHREGEFIFINPKIDSKRFKFAEDPDKNPYKGLAPYETADAPVFFGRERVVQEVVARLRQEDADILFITGPSGSGKSSLAKAGVFPVLKEYEVFLSVRPSELLPANSAPSAPHTDKLESLQGELASGKRCALLIDQYEELFSHPDKEQLQELVMHLITAVQENQQRAIFTMRSDFEWQLKSSPLGEYWEKKRIYRVPPMDLDELRQAITGPAWWAMYDFRDKEETDEGDTGEELINEILEEVANAPGALPLLSFTMKAFYEIAKDKSRKQRLILEDYRHALQGVSGALSQRAGGLYDGLPNEAHRRAMKNILLRMATLDDGGYSRRRIFLSYPDLPGLNELDFPGDQDDRFAEEVLRQMEAAHLVAQGQDNKGHRYVEPVHDALINFWPKCRQWIDEFGKENLSLQRQLWQAVLENRSWEQNPATARSQEAPPFWNNNPKLQQLQMAITDPRGEWLCTKSSAGRNIESIAFLLWEEDPDSEQLVALENWNWYFQKDTPSERFEDVRKQMAPWLNQAELDFVKKSFQLQRTELERLKAQRDEALAAAEAAKALVQLPSDVLTKLSQDMQEYRTANALEFAKKLNKKLKDPKDSYYQAVISSLGNSKPYIVSYLEERDNWVIWCGTLKGLPVYSDLPVQVDIFEATEERFVCQATLQRPDLNHSVLNFVAEPKLSRNKNYRGVFPRFPADPEYVNFLAKDPEGQQLLEQFMEKWDASLNILTVVNSALPERYAYEVAATRAGLDFRKDGFLFMNLATEAGDFFRKAMDIVKILVWEDRFRQMNDQQSRIGGSIQLGVVIEDNTGKKKEYRKGEIKIYSTVSEGNHSSKREQGTISPFAEAVGGQEPLHCYLFVIPGDASILHPGEAVQFTPEGAARTELWEKGAPYKFEQREVFFSLSLKLLVTTHPIPYELLTRPSAEKELHSRNFEFENLKGEGQNSTPVYLPKEGAWHSLTRTIHFINPLNEINDTADTALLGGEIRILPHVSLRARVCMLPCLGPRLSYDPGNHFSQLSTKGFRLMSITSEEGNRYQVLEAIEITGNEPEKLKETPLEIQLKKTLPDNQMVVAVAFDGMGFRFIGEGDEENGHTLIHLYEFPQPAPQFIEDGAYVKNPFGKESLDPSLFYALKVAFFIKDIDAPIPIGIQQ